ncbi:MAG: hypothetical protein AAGD38_03010 [Acidobacteriota bacterium]
MPKDRERTIVVGPKPGKENRRSGHRRAKAHRVPIKGSSEDKLRGPGNERIGRTLAEVTEQLLRRAIQTHLATREKMYRQVEPVSSIKHPESRVANKRDELELVVADIHEALIEISESYENEAVMYETDIASDRKAAEREPEIGSAFKSEALPESTRLSESIEERIEHLYDRIIILAETTAEDSNRVEIDELWSQLRSLQRIEAEQYRQRFEASLEMPIDAGQRILENARKLRRELEDITASDTTTSDSNSPST